jgi:hypothetical protein
MFVRAPAPPEFVSIPADAHEGDRELMTPQPRDGER